MTKRLDDLAVIAALAAVALLCLGVRYLPMIDLPQHYAMVSIIANHGDSAYGFADRFTFDFAGRPYATVYVFAAGLAKLMPLGAAMRITVALCTVAPLAGLYALLSATGRPRIYTLFALPLAFGSIWHWGFLNFLLGTGMMMALLALVVRQARWPTRRGQVALGVLAVVLLLTHFHGLAMLVGLAPVFAWAWRKEGTSTLGSLRTCLPLAPAVALAGLFVLTTWSQAKGAWSRMNPGLGERVRSFPEFLSAGIPEPWPLASVLIMAVSGAGMWALFWAWERRGAGESAARTSDTMPRHWLALGFGAASQLGFYLVLPLNTRTATYLSARHALLLMLFAVALLPVLTGLRLHLARAAAGAVAIAVLIIGVQHLRAFDREASGFAAVVAKMQPNRRVVPLIFKPRSEEVHPRVFPYLHFAAYYQAYRGGDLSRSFALVWNVPVRYRKSYQRYALDESIEFNPFRFSLKRDLPHYDYMLLRAPRPPRFPPELGLRLTAQSGKWSVWENPRAVTP